LWSPVAIPASADTADTNEPVARLNRTRRPSDQPVIERFPLENGTGGIAMTTELEAIMGSDLVTTVFLYGSAAMLVAQMLIVTWMERGSTREAMHTAEAKA
jgi:hypothetical protein